MRYALAMLEIQRYTKDLPDIDLEYTWAMPEICLRDAFQKKNYVDRETVPKVGRGVAPFPYKNHSWDREYSSIDRGV